MSQPAFMRYPSIQNHYKDGWVDMCREATDCEWVVTEKIHGANISIAAWKNGACAGRRSSWLDVKGGEVFHGLTHEAEFMDLGAKAQRALAEVPGADVVYFYGEIYGGSGRKPVQKEVKYTDGISVTFFDVLVSAQGTSRWLNRTEAERVCKTADLPWVATLFRGSLQDALEYSKAHYCEPTTWGTGSVREGHVLMPEESARIYIKGEPHRVGIKHKSPAFTERGTLTDATTDGVSLVKSFINKARWDSVRSKERENLSIAEGIHLLVNDATAEAGVVLSPLEFRACSKLASLIVRAH